MSAPASPTVRRRRLAAELREIRESKGRSGESVAAALRWSPSKISRYERARTGLRPREVARLLDYYQITGARRALLLELAANANVALSRTRLLDRVWGLDFRGDERTVDVHVRRVRERLERYFRLPQLIVTIRGYGYKFVYAD